MSDDLRRINFPVIADDLTKGRVIPLLGAGASSFPDHHAKPPTGSTLALTLAKSWNHPDYEAAERSFGIVDPSALERHLHARLACTNLPLVASWVEQVAADRFRLQQKLREELADSDRPLPFNELHELLADVAREAPLAIITTNYDDLMESALEIGASHSISL